MNPCRLRGGGRPFGTGEGLRNERDDDLLLG
jgi:hypothetical protein